MTHETKKISIEAVEFDGSEESVAKIRALFPHIEPEEMTHNSELGVLWIGNDGYIPGTFFWKGPGDKGFCWATREQFDYFFKPILKRGKVK